MGAGNAILLKGDLHIDVLTSAGAETGQRTALNALTLKLTPPGSKELEQKSFMLDTYGQTLDSVPLPGDSAKIEFETDSFPRDQWDLFFSGSTSTLSQSAGTAVAYSITAKLDKWVPLGNDHIQLTTLAVTSPAGLTEGDDYEVDYQSGRFRALSGGDIAADATVAGTYAHAAVTGIDLQGASQVSRKCALVLKGHNIADGWEVVLDVWQSSLKFGEISPIGDNFMKVKAEGVLTTPAGKNAPYRLRSWPKPAA